MAAPQAQTTADQNKQTMVRWFDEVWTQGRRETINELYAENGVLHDGSTIYRGREEFCRFYDAMHSQFSDFYATKIVSLAEGKLACHHWSMSFRHKATNKAVQVTGTSIVLFENGKLIEAWQNWDAAGLSDQLPGFSIASVASPSV
jgi:predicted SnoaL-like aldol condensation-catalyzing enzyme